MSAISVPLRVAVAIALIAISGARSASADEARDRARQHFDRALRHIEAKELRPALAELEAAHALHPHYAVLYNIGKVAVELGDPVRAVAELERYLELGGAQVSPQRRTEVERILLEQGNKIARVTLVIKPDGARVSIAGKEAGKSPLSRPLLLLPGKHLLEVTLSGHTPEKRSLELAPGSRQSLTIELDPAPATLSALGSVGIDCPLADVTLRVDGRPYAKTAKSTLLLPIGARELSFERPGYGPSRHRVLVEQSGNATVRCNLRPIAELPAASAGKIAVVLGERHSVHVDGLALPAGGRVPAGRHQLEVRAIGYRRWSSYVVVEPGKTLRVEPALEPDADTIRSRQAQRTTAYLLGAHGLGILAGAGIMYVWNTTRHQEWIDTQKNIDDDWDNSSTWDPDLERRQTLNDEQLESIRRFDRLTVGLTVVGGALVTAGVIVYVTGADPNPRSEPVLAVGTRGSTVGWSWAW